MVKLIGYMVGATAADNRPVHYREETEHAQAGIHWIGHDGDNYTLYFGEHDEYSSLDEYLDYVTSQGWFIKEQE